MGSPRGRSLRSSAPLTGPVSAREVVLISRNPVGLSTGLAPPRSYCHLWWILTRARLVQPLTAQQRLRLTRSKTPGHSRSRLPVGQKKKDAVGWEGEVALLGAHQVRPSGVPQARPLRPCQLGRSCASDLICVSPVVLRWSKMSLAASPPVVPPGVVVPTRPPPSRLPGHRPHRGGAATVSLAGVDRSDHR